MAVKLPNYNEAKIAIIGLGYVGLPLAVEFGKSRSVVGFDINQARIDELSRGKDSTLEVSPEELGKAQHLSFTAKELELKDCSIFIVTVPNPKKKDKQPVLAELINAFKIHSSVISHNTIVNY